MNTTNLDGVSATKQRGGGKKRLNTSALGGAAPPKPTPKPKATRVSKKTQAPTAPPDVVVQSIIALAQEKGVGGKVGVNNAGQLVILLSEWTVLDGKAVKL